MISDQPKEMWLQNICHHQQYQLLYNAVAAAVRCHCHHGDAMS
jgi:nitrite reductase/ring-hydroxylating ferredoxin subunit